jgi:CDP-4-dehydro-6-deoxyglucose reductase
MSLSVRLEPSGHTFQVASGDSILAAGLNAGFALPFSCRQGVCRSCRGTLISGEVDMGDVHPAYLSEADRAKGAVHLCQAKPLSDVTIQVRELEGLAGVRVAKIPCRVAEITKAAPDVSIVKLRLPLNENMMFAAGQHIEFLLPDEKRRNYSIASKPSIEGVTQIELHIRHMPGGYFTENVLSKMKARDLMRFEGPLGSFYLRTETQKPILMVAGSTGFAPLKSMCEQIFERNINASRPVTLYWGARTRDGLYMLALAEEWARTQKNFRFVPVLSEPTPACNWTGPTGLVHEAVLADIADMSGTEAYVCGPPAMVEAARETFIGKAGLAEDAFYADSFLTAVDTAA